MEFVTALRSLGAVFLVLFCLLPIASPAPERSPSHLDDAVPALIDDVTSGFTDPWPGKVGLPPLPGFPTLLHLQKRQCLENGSNFCFPDDETRFCPGCGACCSLGSDNWCCTEGDAKCCPGKTCCAAGATCCGEGCCEKGQKCTNGKCEVPVVTTTTTSTRTVHTTRTHTQVEIVTVQMKVEVTSTINSVLTETVTSADGTHTEITYVTTTVKEEKRSLPTDAAYSHRREARSADTAKVGVFLRLWRRLVFGGHTQRPDFDERGLPVSPTVVRRATPFREVERRQEDGSTTTTTVVVTTTIESKTTVRDRRTTTDFITSTVETTIYQTSTRVIGARETISRTVTVTMTSKAPTTQTITSTSTSLIDPTDAPQTGGISPSDTPIPIEETERKGLSTSAMIGIGVGSGVAALTLGAVLFFLWRRSKKRKQQQSGMPYDYVIAPAPAPIPSRHRTASDTTYEYGFAGSKVSPTATPAHSRGHSRSISATTTQVSSAHPSMYGDPGGRGSWVPPGGVAGAPGDPAARPQMRTIPHPNTSTVGRRTRFAELDG